MITNVSKVPLVIKIITDIKQCLNRKQASIDERYGLAEKTGRLGFIDFIRGMAMLVMAWDHVTGFWNDVHGGLEGIVKVRQGNLDLLHFMSRFITHFCAPTFIFLAGTSIALMSKSRRDRGQSENAISLRARSLDEELHSVIDGMSEDVSIKQMGGKVKTYVGENCTAHYVYGEFSQRGINFNAIISLQIIQWESLRSYRGYIVGYIALEGIYEEAELDTIFRAFMDDFNPDTK